MMVAFISYILVSVFSPGPNNIFASISTSRIGLRKTFRFMLGIFLGTFLVFAISGIITVYLYTNIRIVTKIIGVLGGFFILYLSISMMFSKIGEEKLLIKNDRLFTMAVILNFINAKTIIFGFTICAYYLELGFSTTFLPVFLFIMAFLCFLAVLAWGLLGYFFKQLLQKYRLGFNILMSLLLAYSAIMIIIESLR